MGSPDGLAHPSLGAASSVENIVGAATINSHAYTLDGAGNRTALDEFVAGLATPSSSDLSS